MSHSKARKLYSGPAVLGGAFALSPPQIFADQSKLFQTEWENYAHPTFLLIPLPDFRTIRRLCPYNTLKLIRTFKKRQT